METPKAFFLFMYLFCFVLGIKLFTSLSCSPHTYQVVDAVVDALTSQAPRDRYLVGLDARVLVWLSWFPSAVSDFLLTGFIKLIS